VSTDLAYAVLAQLGRAKRRDDSLAITGGEDPVFVTPWRIAAAGSAALGAVGLAVSDPSGVLASPLATLERGRDYGDDHKGIIAVALDADAILIVVGLPRSLSGEFGPAAVKVLAEVAELGARADAIGLPVETYDERFTTMIAQRNLRESTPRRGRSACRGTCSSMCAPRSGRGPPAR